MLVGNNGERAYSNVVRVVNTNDDDSLIRVIPNPVKETTKLYYNSAAQTKGLVRVIDPMGRTRFSVNVFLQKGFNIVALPELQHLSSGLYFVQLFDANSRSLGFQKIIKSN